MPVFRPEIAEMKKRVNIKKFAKNYVRNGGNAKQAFLATRPTSRNPGQSANALISRPEVREAIRQALEDYDLGMDTIVGTRRQMLDAAKKQMKLMKFTPADLDKNLTGLMEIHDRLEKKNLQSNSLHAHLHINQDSNYSEVIKQRNVMASWFDKVLEGETVESTDTVDITNK